MTERPPKRHIEALRACRLCRGGMRYEAHLTAMRALEVLGYAEARPLQSRPRELRWFLTPAGRELLEALGTGEPEE
jgi:hypothetical protein